LAAAGSMFGQASGVIEDTESNVVGEEWIVGSGRFLIKLTHRVADGGRNGRRIRIENLRTHGVRDVWQQDRGSEEP
jgi:hypothetical protein